MGLRPDITAQVARIDARSLQQPGPARLCYAGPVFRARPEGLFPFRTPERVGAELYGVPGPEGTPRCRAHGGGAGNRGCGAGEC